ncbi:MAG: glutathione S-transferase family protein [Gammaproteobacteria bacterium]|nr:glutathione S-transferase family protein [Gammaproteobacteria bacterium]
MQLVLYHSVESTCAQKVRLVMAEKGLEWEENRLNLRKGEQFSPDYLKLNPKAVVPTLVHGDTVVRESSIINEYLEDCFPEPALRPFAPGERAQMRLLIKTIDDEVHGAIGVLSYAIFLRHQMNERLSPAELAEHFQKVADPARRERQQKTHEKGLQSPAAGLAIQTLRRFVSQLAESLAGRDWLASEKYTLADAAALPYMFRARALHLTPLWDDQPELAAWLERGLAHAEVLPLEDVWGSASFHAMVARHADAADHDIQQRIQLTAAP